MKPNRKPAIIVVSVIAVVGFLLWVNWYNSTDQKLQRCITAEGQEWEHQVQTDPTAQMLHYEGADPPMALSILDCDDKLGIKP